MEEIKLNKMKERIHNALGGVLSELSFKISTQTEFSIDRVYETSKRLIDKEVDPIILGLISQLRNHFNNKKC